MYLVAVMDWAGRQVLNCRLSNTFDSRFCVDAYKEVLYRYGAPDIFNSDQGGLFISKAFTGVLKQWQGSAWTAEAASRTVSTLAPPSL